MKKTAIIVGAILASLSITPVQAAEVKPLVIIDSYFDSRVASENVSCIVVQTELPCTNVVTSIPTSLSDEINHGNAMVEVAKKQNPNIKIIALRSGSPSTKSVSGVNPATFISALRWVEKNQSKVGAVSFSRYFNHASKPCMPTASSPYTPESADLEIKRIISSLKSAGVPVFSSTGNTSGKKVDYPACILDINSVGVGSLNKLGALVVSGAADANTDFFAPLGGNLAYVSPVLGRIANTTSSATVAVAARYVSGLLDNKFVNVLQ
jgi:hypothetical protein